MAAEPSSPPPPSRPVVPQPGTARPPAAPLAPAPAAPAATEEERVARLRVETEKLASSVANLCSRTLGGPSPLEVKWKEVQEMVEQVGGRRSVSVARCYPALNRVPDVLPYDQTRVELQGGKDDYINASRVAGPSESVVGAVVTQAPSRRALADFWRLVWQEGCTLMVCLVPDHDLGDAVYLPAEREKVEVAHFTVATFSSRQHAAYTERVVNITNSQTNVTRTVVHLQMVGWPGPDLPTSPSCLLETAAAVLAHRSRAAVLVHCVDGSSKSGTFLSVLWLVAGMEGASGPCVPPAPWPPVAQVVALVMAQRKGIIRDKQFLRLVYDSLLYFCQDALMKLGILNTGQAGGRGHSRHPSLDFVVPASLPAPVEPPAVLPPSTVATTVPPDVVASTPSLPEAKVLQESKEAAVAGVAGVAAQEETSRPPASALPDDLTKLADISLTESPRKQKFSKEDFLNPSSRMGSREQNPADPLAMLDPLWTLK